MASLNCEAKRVFNHELGHFVADIINHEEYQTPKVTEFSLQHDVESDDYAGHVKIAMSITPQDLPTSQLGCRLASLVYGCLFQAYGDKNADTDEKKIQLVEQCLGRHGQGKDDTGLHREYAIAKSLTMVLAKISSLENGHFRDIISNNRLDDFFKCDLSHHCEAEGKNYKVNITTLERELRKAIDSYKEIYKGFVKELDELIAQLRVSPAEEIE